MNILHISDTHTYHDLLDLQTEGIHVLVYSGDGASSNDSMENIQEMFSFLEWMQKIPIQNKIYVAGNHDVSIDRGTLDREVFKQYGIHYLEDSSIVINNVKFYGSPYTTPSGKKQWAFQRAHHKMFNVWMKIEEDTDVLITHGPPKGILDVSDKEDGSIESCGCQSLFNRIDHIKPKAHLFGHIHNAQYIKNAGLYKPLGMGTIFSNGAVVKDREFGKVIGNGNIVSI